MVLREGFAVDAAKSNQKRLDNFNSLRLSASFRQNLALAFSRNEVSKIVEYGRLRLLNGLRPHRNWHLLVLGLIFGFIRF
jgi:hypothetical protein